MPIVERKDNIGDTTSSTGTGTINLSAVAQVGSRIFAGNVTTGATVRYLIETADKSEWEVGEGVFTDSSPDTLTRVTVYASSNAGSLVNFSAGTKNVSMIASAKDFDIADNIHSATAKTTPVDADELAIADSAASWALKKITILAIKLAVYVGIKPQEGTMWNGKISVTDTGSGLTLALKTLAGTDPSSSDPVYITLSGSVRTITSALSHTVDDGTNWLNAGSTELATKEIDYFAFLGWSTVDSAVHIGFSRWPTDGTVPTAGTTNEKGSCINGSMNSGDSVEVIGRFAATLSSGAGYTWSVPTYTPINLIQRPIYETRLLDYVVSITNSNSAITYTTRVGRYRVSRSKVDLRFNIVINTVTTNGNELRITTPFTSATLSQSLWGIGKYLDSGVAHYIMAVISQSATAYLILWAYNGGAPISGTPSSAGDQYDGTITIEI